MRSHMKPRHRERLLAHVIIGQAVPLLRLLLPILACTWFALVAAGQTRLGLEKGNRSLLGMDKSRPCDELAIRTLQEFKESPDLWLPDRFENYQQLELGIAIPQASIDLDALLSSDNAEALGPNALDKLMDDIGAVRHYPVLLGGRVVSKFVFKYDSSLKDWSLVAQGGATLERAAYTQRGRLATPNRRIEDFLWVSFPDLNRDYLYFSDENVPMLAPLKSDKENHWEPGQVLQAAIVMNVLRAYAREKQADLRRAPG